MTEGIKVGELYTELLLDKSKYGSGLKDAEAQTRGFSGKMGSIFAGIGVSIGMYLTQAADKVVDFAKDSIASAESMEKALGLVKAAYGKSSDVVVKWADDNAIALGATDDSLATSLAKYGIWAQNVGKSTKSATKDGEELATRASEIARSTGGDYDTIFAALLKGEQGATKGLKGYGVAVSNTAIKDEALRLGLIHGKEKLTDLDKATALHSIIMRQTAKYTDLAAESNDKLWVKEAKLGVVFDKVKEALGFLFIDLVSKIVDGLMPIVMGMFAWFEKNMPAIQKIFEDVMSAIGTAIGIAMAAVQPLVDAVIAFGSAIVDFLSQGNNFNDFLIALGAIVLAVVVPPFLAWAAATIVALAPIIAVVAAVTAVVIVLDQLGILSQIVTVATQLFGAAVQWLQANVLPLLQAALEYITATVLPAIGAAFRWIADNVLPALGAAFQWVVDNVLPALGVAFDWIVANVFPVFGAAIDLIANTVVPLIGDAFGWLTNDVVPALGSVFDWVSTHVLPLLSGAFDWISTNVVPALATVFKFVAEEVIPGFGHVIDWVVKNVMPPLASVLDWLSKNVLPLVSSAFAFITDKVIPALGAAFDWVVKNVIPPVLDILGVVTSVVGKVIDAFGKIPDAVGKAWSGATTFVKGAINAIIGLVNGMIDAINGINMHIDLKPPVGPEIKFDWDGLKLGRIPYLAKGLMNVPTPMMAMLHAGEAVLPATAAADYRYGRNGFGDRGSPGGGSTILNANFYVTKDQTPEQFARDSLLALKREVRRQGMSLAGS